MAVVSNTSPLNYLILIGHAEILSTLYETVAIPHAVMDELTAASTPPSVREWALNQPAWLNVQRPVDRVDSELEQIQIGERQAILLAKEIRPDFIILDDRKARRLAERRGLSVIGTLGVLTTAAEQGLMSFSEALEELKRTNFRVSPGLLESLVNRSR
jgi:predicted nucleic acid-binding protein